jgi:hypothetical protein
MKKRERMAGASVAQTKRGARREIRTRTRSGKRGATVLLRGPRAGAVWVTSRCRALLHSAHLALKIVRISSVFACLDRLLICGLTVRFRPGSPAFPKKFAADESRSASSASRYTPSDTHIVQNLPSSVFDGADQRRVKMAFICWAASCCSVGMMWAYVSNVRLI